LLRGFRFERYADIWDEKDLLEMFPFEVSKICGILKLRIGLGVPYLTCSMFFLNFAYYDALL